MDFVSYIVLSYLLKHASSHHDKQWQEFKRKYNKKYGPGEDPIRRAIFHKRLDHARKSHESINKAELTSQSQHFLAINQFSDMV